ncbi:MAG: hypothetical protein M3R47_21100, partial [Chloroflexota bacterium]|nr:hypothetical protein [Chloroflexota bacterium]
MATISAQEFFKGGDPKKAKVVQPAASQADTSTQQNKPGYVQRVATDIKGNISQAWESEKASARGDMNPIYAGFNIAKNLSGAAISPLAEVPGLKQLGEGFGRAGQAIVDTKIGNQVTDSMARNVSPETLGAVSDVAETGLNVTGLYGGVKSVKGGYSYATQLMDELSIKSPKLQSIPDAANKLVDFISRDPEAKTATILKEMSTDKFNKYIQIAEESAIDPRKPTAYEVAGNEAGVALEKLNTRMNAVGEQKSSIIEKAKIGGLDVMSDAKAASMKVYKAFSKAEGADKALAEWVFNKLRNVKRLGEGDAVIDEIQKKIYKDSKNLTISLDKAGVKQLQSIVEEFNSAIKEKAGP